MVVAPAAAKIRTHERPVDVVRAGPAEAVPQAASFRRSAQHRTADGHGCNCRNDQFLHSDPPTYSEGKHRRAAVLSLCRRGDRHRDRHSLRHCHQAVGQFPAAGVRSRIRLLQRRLSPARKVGAAAILAKSEPPASAAAPAQGDCAAARLAKTVALVKIRGPSPEQGRYALAARFSRSEVFLESGGDFIIIEVGVEDHQAALGIPR